MFVQFGVVEGEVRAASRATVSNESINGWMEVPRFATGHLRQQEGKCTDRTIKLGKNFQALCSITCESRSRAGDP